jgi:predicted nucleotidyltransferase
MTTTMQTRRQHHVQTLAAELAGLVEQLRRIRAVQKVILFGSYAQGRADLFTDLDLLVVMPSTLDFVSRCVWLAGQLRTGVALDLLVYTPAELEQMRNRPFIRQIMQTGKVLYEKKST